MSVIYGKRFKDTDVYELTIYDIYLGQGCDPNVKRERLKYRPIRGLIEEIVKLAKDAFSLMKLHRYTKRSVGKIICLNVLPLFTRFPKSQNPNLKQYLFSSIVAIEEKWTKFISALAARNLKS